MTDNGDPHCCSHCCSRGRGAKLFRADVLHSGGYPILARAFEDMRAAGLDDSAIARLLRYAVEELDKHAIEEFEK